MTRQDYIGCITCAARGEFVPVAVLKASANAVSPEDVRAHAPASPDPIESLVRGGILDADHEPMPYAVV